MEFSEVGPLVRLVDVRLVEARGEMVAEPSPALTHSKAVAEFVRELLVSQDREHFACLHLDARNRARSCELVSKGSLVASLVHPREVFKGAILANSASVLLVHNHPSGVTNPSAEDDSICKRLYEAGELLGIKVLDFVIVAPGAEHFSYCDERRDPFK